MIPVSTISFEFIPYGQGILKASFNISLDIHKDDDVFIASLPSLNIEICESSIDDVKESFCNDIRFLWDEFAMAEDDELTNDVKKMKALLKECFSLSTQNDFYQSSTSSRYSYSHIGNYAYVNA